MAVTQRDIRAVGSSEHIAQFFDSDESRAESVAAFLAEGYRAGEPLIIVARATTWALTMEALEADGVPVQRAIAERMLIVKDAADTLRRLSRNIGTPDAASFETEVAAGVIALGRRGRVRAYGEMVDLLAQRMEFDEVVRLEEFWNVLATRVPLYLMCGYSAANFVSTGTHGALRHICRLHAEVHRATADPLATWVLNSAHDASDGAGAISLS